MKKLKLKLLLQSFTVGIAILAVAVFLINIPFTACEPASKWCTIAFALTQSAGKTGTAMLILIASLMYSIRFNEPKLFVLNLFKSMVSLFILLGIVAYTNEHLTKKLLHVTRPSHTYILEHAEHSFPIDSLYQLPVEARKEALEKLIKSNVYFNTHINEKVLSHWVDEAGYSFPSGHTFNAFLLASILSFSLINAQRKIIHYFFSLPIVWAISVGISRVALGAHSATDVTIGAMMGTGIGFLLLYFDNIRKFVIHKKHVQ